MMKIKLLLYCTKAKPFIYYDSDDKTVWKSHDIDKPNSYHLNGKIVAECECQKVEEIHISSEKRLGEETKYHIYSSKEDEDLGNYYREDYIEKETCLKCNEISNYLNKGKGYALHLSNLKIFDKPRELNDFFKDIFPKLYEKWEDHRIKKAPQNMCYCYDEEGNKYILISIRPEWLCKILNGKKTIEIRKQILNCLKELI